MAAIFLRDIFNLLRSIKSAISLATISTVVALLSSCSITGLVNSATPTDASSVEEGLSYGPLPRQKLDVYRPMAPDTEKGVVIFFYGGAWKRGNRGDYEFLARKLADRGFTVVVPDYRVYPEVIFPGFVEDGAQATVYVLEQLTEVTTQKQPLFLMGHSAGAQIAMLIALDESYLEGFDHSPTELSGVIGLSGPYNFLPIKSTTLRKIFPSDSRPASQPINFVTAGAPPLFLAHGSSDNRVWVENSTSLASAMTSNGNLVTTRIYDGVGHIGILKPFTPFFKDKLGLLQELDTFSQTNRM